jgi:hypothetical protein
MRLPLIAALLLPDSSANPADPVRLASAMAHSGHGRLLAIAAGPTHDYNIERVSELGIEEAWSIADAHFSDSATSDRLVAAFTCALTSTEVVGDHRPNLVLLPNSTSGDEIAARWPRSSTGHLWGGVRTFHSTGHRVLPHATRMGDVSRCACGRREPPIAL